VRRDPGSLRIVVFVVVAFAAITLYLSWPAPTDRPVGGDSLAPGTAALILAYLFYPALLLLAASLLVIAVMLLAARLIEHRRAGRLL
jgi:hypothetical protein